MRVFCSVDVFSPSDLSDEFRQSRSRLICRHKRGHGLWCWKPEVILRKLCLMRPDDWLCYLDAGCSLNIEGRNRFSEYLDIAADSPVPWLAFSLTHPVGAYTKRDLLRALGADTGEMRKRAMLVAGVHFVRAAEVTIGLASRWQELMGCERLIDDSQSADEHPGFIEHRHDQSVFSLLAIEQGVTTLPDETYFEPDWDAHRDKPIHARRWKHRIAWPTRWMRRPALCCWLRRL